jgi:hypothetical protein
MRYIFKKLVKAPPNLLKDAAAIRGWVFSCELSAFLNLTFGKVNYFLSIAFHKNRNPIRAEWLIWENHHSTKLNTSLTFQYTPYDHRRIKISSK